MRPEPKIDDVDVKILQTLLKEPRTSFAKIAKECELSIPSIHNRFTLMNKSGIINGSIMQIDPKSLGYYCVALINIEADPRKKEVILDFLKQINIAIYGPHLSGRSNILGFLVARNTDELAQTIKEIKKNIRVRSVFTEQWVNTKDTDHPENLIIKKIDDPSSLTKMDTEKKNALQSTKNPNNQEKNRNKNDVAHQLDNIDLSLIKIVINDARVSFRRIAEKLGISTNNVIKRYKKLRNNVLTFSSITLDLTKLGYIGSGVMMIKVRNEYDTKEILDQILLIPNVIVSIRLFGNYDILVITPFRNFEDLENMNKKIASILGVYEIQLMIDKPYVEWPLNTISNLIIKKIEQ